MASRVRGTIRWSSNTSRASSGSISKCGTQPVPEARPAATVVVLRPGTQGPEVLLLQRSQRSGFFPHAWVFPGGRVDAADHDAATSGSIDGLPADASAFAVAAVRECFEEAGVWLGTGRPGRAEGPPQCPGGHPRDASCWWPTSTGWTMGVVDHAGGEPRRYDTRFFVTAVTRAEVAHAAPDSRETVDARWLRPADALAAGDVFLAPPTFRTLEELAALAQKTDGDLDEMMRAAASRSVDPIQPRLEKDDEGSMTIILPGDPDHPSSTPSPGPKRIVWQGTAGGARVMSSSLLFSEAWPWPCRCGAPPGDPPVLEPGRQADVLVVKLAEDLGIVIEDGRWSRRPGGRFPAGSPRCEPAAPTGRARNSETARRVDPEGRLADLTLYVEVHGDSLETRAADIVQDARVETAFFALAPVRPPDEDLPPDAGPPCRADVQEDAPDGLGWREVAGWTGEEENPVHQTRVWLESQSRGPLRSRPRCAGLGLAERVLPCHGVGIGVLVAGDNGYGVSILVPDTDVLMVSPYEPTSRSYNIASSIDGISALLEAGDVLLIEQQAYANGAYAPVEVAGCLGRHQSCVAAGIVVVEPGGNGS